VRQIRPLKAASFSATENPMYDKSKLSELIRFARVDAGSTVIDVYPGDGDWTRLFSDIVGPEGRVYSFVPAEVAHFKNDPVGRMRILAKEQLNAKQLEREMRGEEPISHARCVLMYFTSDQYAEFEEALLKNGAETSGRGIVGKEDALINALRKAIPELENVQPKGKPAQEPSQNSK
jgi:predicted methyltransferase